MDKRIRSPNYPALSLPEAIKRVQALYGAHHTHAAPREVVAKGLGYNSLNGASMTAISALQKYGLIDRAGDGLKVSERALRILLPHSPVERATAIQEAANDPPLFAELKENFPDRIPGDDLLRNYLLRRGFAPGAVSSVIAAYRETSEMAEEEVRAHDSLHGQSQEHAAAMSAAQQIPAFANEIRSSVGPAMQSQASPKAPQPVIAIMEDHIIVNMVIRTRDKARALRHMIEMVEGMLPEASGGADDAAKLAAHEPEPVGRAMVATARPAFVSAAAGDDDEF